METFNEKQLYEKIKQGTLPLNWAADIMKTIWGSELASNINDNKQSK